MKMNIRGKRILVVGATGFIGGNLVDRLAKEKAQIRVIIRSKESKPRFGKLGVQFCKGDLLDIGSLQSAIKNVEYVFNASGALPHHHLLDEEYWRVNVEGVENLMLVAKKEKVRRLIHVSTTGIFGEKTDGANEKTKPVPKGIYAKTKLAGEQIVSKYGMRGISTVIIRPTIAYGPGDVRPVILSLCRLINRGVFIPIGNGRNYFHTVYIDNLVEALLQAVNKEGIDGESFNVGDDHCPTVNELWSLIAEILEKSISSSYIPRQVALFVAKPFDVLSAFGLTVPITTQKVKFITDDKRYNMAKARRVLGYKSKVELREGLLRTIDWYNERNLL